MTNKIDIAFIRRRFANIIAPAIGWNVGPAYSVKQGEDRATPNPGNVWIEQAPNKKYWRVCQIGNMSGGERNLCDNYTKSELMAWMDGVLKASDIFNARTKG